MWSVECLHLDIHEHALVVQNVAKLHHHAEYWLVNRKKVQFPCENETITASDWNSPDTGLEHLNKMVTCRKKREDDWLLYLTQCRQKLCWVLLENGRKRWFQRSSRHSTLLLLRTLESILCVASMYTSLHIVSLASSYLLLFHCFIDLNSPTCHCLRHVIALN